MVASTLEYMPAEHVVHPDVVEAIEPAAQTSLAAQVLEPGLEKESVGQAAHSLAPSAAAKELAGHGAQAEAPSEAAKKPAAQPEQVAIALRLVEVMNEYLPGAQAEHEDAPTEVW